MRNKKSIKQSLSKTYVPVLFLLFAGFIVLFLPVFYLKGSMDHTMMPQMLAVSIFQLLFSFVLFHKKIFPQLDLSVLRHKVFYVLAAYFLVTLFSITVAVNPQESIFDIVKTFAFITLIALGSLLFAGTGNWQEKLPKFFLFAAFTACIIGFVQYYERVFLSPDDLLPDGRRIIYAVDGMMSHKNLFSLALMMMLPFVGYGVYIFRKGWRMAAMVAVFLLLMMIFLLQTRAVWAGLMISISICLVLLILFAKKFNLSKHGRNVMITGGFALIAGIAVLVVFAGKNSRNPYLLHLKSITDPTSEQNVNRLKTWSVTTEMIHDNLITGVGAGNWKLIAPKYYSGKFTAKDELNWLRPHNDYLWVMAEKGIFGILLFLSIFGISIYCLIAVICRAGLHDKVLSLFFLAGMVSYLIAAGFDFPSERILHQAFLSLFIAGSIALYQKTEPAKPVKVSRIPVFVTFLLIFSFSVVFTFSAVRQEIYVKKVWADNQAQNWESMLHHALLAQSPLKNMDPLANPIASYVGLAYSELHDIPNSLAAYQEAYRQYPYKLKGITNLALLYEKAGMYKESVDCLMEGLALIPNNLEILRKLCDIYYASGQYKKAIEAYKNIPGWEKDSTLVQNIRLVEGMVKMEK